MYVCKRLNKCRGCLFYICPKMTPCSLTGAKNPVTDSAFFAKTYCTLMINTSGPNFITMKIKMCTFSQLLANIKDMICGQALLLLLLILLQLLLLLLLLLLVLLLEICKASTPQFERLNKHTTTYTMYIEIMLSAIQQTANT